MRGIATAVLLMIALVQLSYAQDSCVGACFQVGSVGSCYCDSVCSQFGNCCSDFVDECANATLCENRCWASYQSGLECQCNDRCASYGNCCEDFYDECLPGSCADSCGVRSTNYTCQCDGTCTAESDCCEDYFDICTTEDSCENLCGASYDGSRSCQCTSDCEDYGNCCDDFTEFCPGIESEYSCFNQCGVTRSKCNCHDDCINEGTCCTDYVQSCKNGTSWLEDECTPEDEMVCPEGFDIPPIILFSMDGFRNSYLYRDITPNLWKLASCGVHAPFVRSVYPTKTFPNHYSIATGLHPESHGIVANTFYDYEIDDEFGIGKPAAYDPRWWGGEPIWITSSKQGVKSASYFWVGSDVNITGYPDYYVPFDSSVPEQDRIQQVLSWLDLPKEDRPSMITAYIEEVDGAGHSVGPDGDTVNNEIEKADFYIGMLMDGLKQRNLDKCVNLIILADHGMADRSCDRVSYIDKYGVDLDSVYFHGGPVGSIGKSEDPADWDKFDPEDLKKKLQCKRLDAHFETYLKEEYLPKRFHHAFNQRIEDVQLVMDEEWIVGGITGTQTSCSGGTHGWDNEFKTMRAVFVSHGSSFKRGYNTSEGFDNFEIYNMMCDILDINPAPNNGTRGSLNHMVRSPKPISYKLDAVNPKSCPYPSDRDLPSYRKGCPYCADETENNKRFAISADQAQKYSAQHILTGTPEISAANQDEVQFCLLTQEEYITAYDWNNKMPYYVSFVLDSKYRYLTGWSFCVRPDLRISDETYSSSCKEFDGTYTDDVTGAFLYPPILSNDYKSDALVLSNVMPVYKPFLPVWRHFAEILHTWSIMYNGTAVIVGPAFDYNFDGLADSKLDLQGLDQITNPNDYTASPIPTHVFAIITRCKDYTNGQTIRSCSTSPENVEVLSFIIPNFKELPCQYNEPMDKSVPRTLMEHVARVRDVELLTGVTFFPDWTTKDGLSQSTLEQGLKLKTHLPDFSSSWLQDFVNTATANPDNTPTPIISTTSSANTISIVSLLTFFIATLISFLYSEN